MIVVDASALVEVLLQTQVAPPIVDGLFSEPGDLAAPHLIDVEVAHFVRRCALTGETTPERAAEALEDLADFPLERSPHTLSLPRIWELRDNLSAYDAAYVALAELLRAPLLTCDRRLARAIRQLDGIATEVLEFPGSTRS